MPFSMADMQRAVLDGVRALVPTGVPAGAVVWSDEPRPAGNVAVVLTIVQLGSDHDRECYTEDETTPGQLVWQMSTLQYMRVQVRCESIYNAPGHDALTLAEHFRAALRRPDIVWGGGEVINKPDINTYLHHVPFPHQGRIVSGWSFETNFRAVTDFPITPAGGLPAGTNMQQVEVLGEDADPPAGNQTIDRT